MKRWNAIVTVVASLKLFFCLEGSNPSLSVWWHLKEEESRLKRRKMTKKKHWVLQWLSASNVLWWCGKCDQRLYFRPCSRRPMQTCRRCGSSTRYYSGAGRFSKTFLSECHYYQLLIILLRVGFQEKRERGGGCRIVCNSSSMVDAASRIHSVIEQSSYARQQSSQMVEQVAQVAQVAHNHC